MTFFRAKINKPLFLLFLITMSNVVWAKPDIVFCFEDKAYPPYIFVDQHSQAAGILVEKIKRAAKQLEINPVFITSPWLRCQKLVKQNQAQALFAMIRTPERAEQFQFPDNPDHHIQLADYPIFYHPDSAFSNNLASLFQHNRFVPDAYKKIKRFGMQAPMGYVAQDYLKTHDLMTTFEYTVEQGLTQVSNNRLDGYIVERQIGLKKIESLALKRAVKITEHPVIQETWFVPFNKTFYEDNKLLIDQFWSMVSQVRIP